MAKGWTEAARRAAAEARKRNASKMRVEFSAVHKGRVMRAVYHLKPSDNYTAMDRIAAKIGPKKYGGLTNKVFQFHAPKMKMSAKLAKVVAGAGPDED